ncbi:hypothetical protein CO057_01025 [Candidatus Uhrbacteria bacterium CG_4_9_14_0_2_um_filter_41_50]|uniref:RES domain-containing protein n=1 Tax=Candidatus Uhrbacteria bacterium CG_4_9_14_0_2_um_filter_41_50 TaxID=1975031 RepID=A0A2M8EPY0_9BACT|nr:MAG: hypothetical protein COZ45_03235 [Candidatus Uhrbacteria bacterium CG_4_10_14_3_um_filter_41_21]PJB84669.1 MAG: hypothetical protein CO086_02460 [Candidatus Uhrbacteria bacterium CG_4_9_14_0_8_um_filter_41_16]PJC24800.1 MAG: hypothetical protein CO057_01025 [Candidatus Uhrbacteria bacterium CG_4_9_14_0_2_um_filter_41_50]
MRENQRSPEKELIKIPEQKENEITAEYLLRLESDGRFLFHGSPNTEIKRLMTGDAYCATGHPDRNRCAVYATDHARLAVMRAILPPPDKTPSCHIVTEMSDGQAILKIRSSIEIQLVDGAVYVLSKGNFRDVPDADWQSYTPINVLKKISVDLADFEALGGVIDQEILDLPPPKPKFTREERFKKD